MSESELANLEDVESEQQPRIVEKEEIGQLGKEFTQVRKEDMIERPRMDLSAMKDSSSKIRRIKIISMGEARVGKTCLIKQYSEERFVSKYYATVGIDYGVKRVDIDGLDVRVNLWDLAGSPDFFEVRNEFYDDAQGGILVFDVTNSKSFEAVVSWIEEASKFGLPEVVFLCGNKTDAKKRVVSMEQGQNLADSLGIPYYETSAKTGENVYEMFHMLFTLVVKSLEG
eukprot:TRINITY_DN10053_c0_g1_i2.p1 TRINITY_DN10053_c0_g1~~TRINITY_DN10053_c0_g1_i2.p1  ORF type:complete len:238 (-),score=63.66 TRINITY_DN10053_c0_g1_i2:34-714(-)